ncbi:cupin domain-containing protein [Chloroflexota bacterium]
MKIIKLSEVSKQEVEAAIFTGGKVAMQPIVTPEMTDQLLVTNVNFSKGAHTKFHIHTVDQVLIVTSGTGIVATENDEVVVTVGDVVHFPGGENHRHGATKDSDFSHIYVMLPGGTTQVQED